MMTLSKCRQAGSALGVLLAASLSMSLAAASSAQAESEVLTVVLDQAKLLKLPDHVATLVVGNPLIAEATVQAGGTIVVTGKGYGATNMVALDRSGNVVMDRTVQVQAPNDTVIVYRGTERQTFSCKPVCEHQIMLGDSAPAFTATMGQTVSRNAQAQGAAR